MEFVIPGRCVPAPRITRMGRRSPRTMRYMSYRQDIVWSAKAAGVRPIPKGEDVAVRIVLYLQKKGNQGDLDNYQKTILDALNGVAWDDDRQVQDIHARRIWVGKQDDERVAVEIWPVAEMSPLKKEVSG